MRLARITWPQAQAYFAEHDTVLMGVGSIECHGRHNPLGTDTMAPDALMDLVEQRDDGLLIAPTMPYGATDDLLGFPGTVSLGVQGLVDVMTSICDQLYGYGARRFVFVNGHGGNVKSLGAVCMELNRRGCLAALFNWWRVAPQLDPAWGGGHGDGMETSANLAIDPEAVDMAACAPEGLRNDVGGAFQTTGWTTVALDGVEVDFPRRLERFSTNGWLGYGLGVEPADASAERGRAMLEGTADYLVRFARALQEAPLPAPLDDAAELAAADAYQAELAARGK
jgi:creatinine amidohydrolase